MSEPLLTMLLEGAPEAVSPSGAREQPHKAITDMAISKELFQVNVRNIGVIIRADIVLPSGL